MVNVKLLAVAILLIPLCAGKIHAQTKNDADSCLSQADSARKEVNTYGQKVIATAQSLGTTAKSLASRYDKVTINDCRDANLYQYYAAQLETGLNNASTWLADGVGNVLDASAAYDSAVACYNKMDYAGCVAWCNDSIEYSCMAGNKFVTADGILSDCAIIETAMDNLLKKYE